MLKCLLISTLGISAVNGHGWLTKPAATFDSAAGDKTQFIATIESSTSGFEGTFNTAPSDNVASFTKAFKSSKYKSLKALIDDKAKITVTGATLTCGNAEPTASPQPLPATLEWSHSDSEGFTPSHEGPCEAWCDDVRVFQDDNCAANFKTAPAEMPYEKSKCSGAKMLTFYWMAMHGPTWQVLVFCRHADGHHGDPNFLLRKFLSIDDTAPSTSTTESPSANTPTVTSAPSTGGSPSTSTTPSTSTASAESDCGSYDVAGSESDCDDYDVAGGSEDEGKDTGAQTYQQGSVTG
ncbi:hypothetical protein PF005_g26771 [Phytophthora fragariae]|uniref:SCP domain-containing protein n=1 Tax=Phytophthora fragariae TaxID=53985 RepID=A0A6A3Q8A8_9STRA|nr:hypothetical protein PF003_g11112 [Phytophthora fragariae]KAE8922145.1 hypothetical protein PF009_g27586 [Phytophthora fragariae]KAE8973088.1 hypothetical protein PF011_g25390 [Phytophthora fragariae]KAE9070081.1 hypothetical protein PF010_g26426 [Phytophthora fragariae]KAE9070948.1 hypothetical protein PF007_g26740 [Phytophthora fragariae]